MGRPRRISRFYRFHSNVECLGSFCCRRCSNLLLFLAWRISIGALWQRSEMGIPNPLLVDAPSPRLIQKHTEASKQNKGTADCSSYLK
jgi:hypothetical protein